MRKDAQVRSVISCQSFVPLPFPALRTQAGPCKPLGLSWPLETGMKWGPRMQQRFTFSVVLQGPAEVVPP